MTDTELEVVQEEIKILDSSIAKTMEAITEVEEQGYLLQKFDQKKRNKTADDIDDQIRKFEVEKAILSDLAIKAKNVEEIDKNQKEILNKCIKTPSFELQETSLQETMNGWFRNIIKTGVVDDILANLISSEPQRTIYLANLDWFNNRDWPMIASVLDNEAAMRSIIIDKLLVKVLILRTIGTKEDFLPSQPNAAELKALMRDLEAMGKRRQELRTRIAQGKGPTVQPENKNVNRQDEMIQKYREILISRDPNLTPEEATTKASLLVDKLLARREELVNKWMQKFLEKDHDLSQEEARRRAEEIVDRQMAEDEANVLGRGTKPTTGREMVTVSSRTETATEKVLNRGSTQAQLDERARIERRAELNAGNFSAKEMVRHPSILVNKVSVFVKDYFKNLFGKKEIQKEENVANISDSTLQKRVPKTGDRVIDMVKSIFKRETKDDAKKAAKEVVKKVGEEAAKKTAKEVVKKVGFKAVLAAIPSGVTQVIAAVLAAKDVAMAVLKKLIPKEIQEKIADIWSKIKIAVFSFFVYFVLAHPLAIALAIIGGVVAGPIGAIAGMALGIAAEGIVGNILGLSGTVGSIGTTIGTGISGLGVGVSTTAVGIWELAAGTGISSIVFWAVPVTISTVSLLGLIMGLTTVVGAISPVNVQGQTRQAIFSLAKKADVTELPDYDGEDATITYTITITPSGENPVKINSIVDKITRQKGSIKTQLGNINVPVPPDLVEVGEPKEISYEFPFSGEEFKDSTLLNFVTVVSEDSVTGEEETQTASVGIRINRPPTIQPYGYPAAGRVTSLDEDSGGQTHWSCFRVFLPGPCRIDGGIDIAGPGGTPVFSTMEGKVIKATWYDDVGGAVYIENGPYITEYLHLEVPSVSTGQEVTRGTQIGETYTGSLPTTRGANPEHVHYQVTLNKANQNFADPANQGDCSQGKIVPGFPGITVSAGPFDCE